MIDSREAFEQAIEVGVLSIHPSESHYAGNYMYVHSDSVGDHFKHIDTRQYVTVYRS